MINYCSGNLLEDDAEALVNAVNCTGVMGAGIAKAFRDRFPIMYEQYKKDCADEHYNVAEIVPWSFQEGNRDRFVFNLPTMHYPGSKAVLEDIYNGLQDLKWLMEHLGIKTAAVPALGCGIGGLTWPTVRQSMVDIFKDAEHLTIRAYSPLGY